MSRKEGNGIRCYCFNIFQVYWSLLYYLHFDTFQSILQNGYMLEFYKVNLTYMKTKIVRSDTETRLRVGISSVNHSM